MILLADGFSGWSKTFIIFFPNTIFPHKIIFMLCFMVYNEKFHVYICNIYLQKELIIILLLKIQIVNKNKEEKKKEKKYVILGFVLPETTTFVGEVFMRVRIWGKK